ncbi:MAG: aminotransferase class I/II-fold pyridoxal phosphate-dependent enzyme [Bacteroidota bacterium]
MFDLLVPGSEKEAGFFYVPRLKTTIDMIIEAAHRLDQIQEYYFSQKLAQIRQMEAQGKKIINLGIGNPDLSPPGAAIRTLQETASSEQNHGYQSYRGLATLRKAIAGWMQKTYGLGLDAEREILPLMGSKEGIFHISLAFLNPGDGVLFPNPGYPTYGAVARMLGARLFPYTLKEENNWQVDWEELEGLPLDQIKLMWLNTPHMPTGSQLSRDNQLKLMDWAHHHRILLVNDNPYSLILPGGAPQSFFQNAPDKEVVLELNSLSKTFHMAGWRVGWLSGQADYLDAVLKVKSNMDSGMFKAIQQGAIAALQTEPSWHKAQNKIYAQRRILTRQLLDRWGCSYESSQSGLFVWAKIPVAFASSRAYSEERLRQHGVFVPPGSIFGSGGEGYIRLSLCIKGDILEDLLKRF